MADAYHHSVSSAKKFGGKPQDYYAIHFWFDETKGWIPDPRHRAIRHHSEGIVECIKEFGDSRGAFYISEAKLIPVRWVAEQHIIEDLGKIPTAADWLKEIILLPWMDRSKKLSKELEEERTRVLD